MGALAELLQDGRRVLVRFTDSEGKLVVKPADLNPGMKWSRNFLARHSARLSRTLPTTPDLTREKWQTKDNFAM